MDPMRKVIVVDESAGTAGQAPQRPKETFVTGRRMIRVLSGNLPTTADSVGSNLPSVVTNTAVRYQCPGDNNECIFTMVRRVQCIKDPFAKVGEVEGSVVEQLQVTIQLRCVKCGWLPTAATYTA